MDHLTVPAGGRGMRKSASESSLSSQSDLGDGSISAEPFGKSDSGIDIAVFAGPPPLKEVPELIEDGSSLLSAVFNLSSSAIGAGALALPYAFGKLGILPAIVVLIISAVMCAYTIFILIRLGNALNVHTFEGLAEHLFGPWGRRVVGVTIFVLALGFCSVYVVVAGQLISPVTKHAGENSGYPSGDWGRRLLVFLVWLVVMLPFSLMRRIDSLKIISSGAVISVIVVFVALLVEAIEVGGDKVKDHAVLFGKGDIEIVQALTNIKVAFSGQTVAFAIYTGLRERTLDNMVKVTNIAMLICSVLYTAVAIAGLLAMGPDVSENVLEGFDDPLGAWHSIAAYIVMFVIIVVSFPIMMFPTRDSVLALMGYSEPTQAPTRVRVPVAAVCATTALVIGLFVDNLNLLFGVVGAICGNLLANIFPAAFALKSGEWTVAKVGWLHRIGALLPLAYGLLVGPLGLAVSLYLTFRPDDDAAGPASPDEYVIPPPENVTAVLNATAQAIVAATQGIAP